MWTYLHRFHIQVFFHFLHILCFNRYIACTYTVMSVFENKEKRIILYYTWKMRKQKKERREIVKEEADNN